MHTSTSTEDFNNLLTKVPVGQRDQIMYFATDQSGRRAGYYRKPLLAADHWHTEQPYVMISSDPSVHDWRGSLIARPRRTVWQFMGSCYRRITGQKPAKPHFG